MDFQIHWQNIPVYNDYLRIKKHGFKEYAGKGFFGKYWNDVKFANKYGIKKYYDQVAPKRAQELAMEKVQSWIMPNKSKSMFN